MKKFTQLILLTIFIVSLADFLNAQTAWMQVKSDNGEFSAEVPQTYDFFYDKDGFIVSDGSAKSYQLEKVHIFTSFQEKTLISFECYEIRNGGAAEAVIEIDKQKMDVSEIKHGAFKIKQIVNNPSDYYWIRQYFRGKNHLYIVTAASRDGETAALKRFMNSIVYSSPGSSAVDKTKTNFSSLKISNINLEIKEDSKYKTPPIPAGTSKDPNVLPTLIVSKPRASYVDPARMRGIQGAVAMRIDLNSNGFIPKIIVVKALPEGLLRQTVFSALRMRFLPSEKNGIPTTVTRTIEYRFTLY